MLGGGGKAPPLHFSPLPPMQTWLECQKRLLLITKEGDFKTVKDVSQGHPVDVSVPPETERPPNVVELQVPSTLAAVR